MQLRAENCPPGTTQQNIRVSVPSTRSDTLHPCDVMEVGATCSQVGDVVQLDEKKDVGAANRRHLAALYCGTNSGFEWIHSLADRVMEVMGAQFVPSGDDTGYCIQRSEAPEFLSGRQARIIYKGKQIGIFGIVHPQVLSNFDIPDPCSFLELDIEMFLEGL